MSLYYKVDKSFVCKAQNLAALLLIISLSAISITPAFAKTPSQNNQSNQTEEGSDTTHIPKTADGEPFDLWIDNKGVMYIKGEEAPWYDNRGVKMQYIPVEKDKDGNEILTPEPIAIDTEEEIAQRKALQQKHLLENKRIETLKEEAKTVEKERRNRHQEQGLEDEDWPYVMGQLLVKYDDDTYRKRTKYLKDGKIVLPDRVLDNDELVEKVTAMDEFFSRNGIEDKVVVKDRMDWMKVEMFDFGRDVDPITMIDLLKINPPEGVVFAQPNFKYEPLSNHSTTADDEYLNMAWHAKAIQLYDAWQVVEDNTATNTATVTVGVIDGGVDFSNTDLVNKKWTEPAGGCVLVGSDGATTTGSCPNGGYDFFLNTYRQ